MIMTSTAAHPLQEHLSRKSSPYCDPLAHIAWGSADEDGFWLPELGLSLYGLPAFHALSVERRQALSRYEFIHLLQAGIWLETLFMERLCRSLRNADGDLAPRIYHLHEIREEAGHTLMFIEMMRRSRLPLPRSPFPALTLSNLVGRHVPFDHAGFWVAVLIGEGVPDQLNRFIRQHRDGICRAACDIASLHVIDEARHIAHARDRLATLVARLPRWQLSLLKLLLRAALREFADALFFPKPLLYELAGLIPARKWAQAARGNPERRRFVEAMTRPVLELLGRSGFRLR